MNIKCQSFSTFLLLISIQMMTDSVFCDPMDSEYGNGLIVRVLTAGDRLRSSDINSDDVRRLSHIPPLYHISGGEVLRYFDPLSAELSSQTLNRIADENLIQSNDQISDNHLFREMNRLSDGKVLDNLKDFDLLNALKNKYLRQNSRSYPINRPKRTGLDSMTGISIGSAKKRSLDPMTGMSFGYEKRNFDEIDGFGFRQFDKKNFDEIDRTAFNGFLKRNFDEIDRSGFGGFVKKREIKGQTSDKSENKINDSNNKP